MVLENTKKDDINVFILPQNNDILDDKKVVRVCRRREVAMQINANENTETLKNETNNPSLLPVRRNRLIYCIVIHSLP